MLLGVLGVILPVVPGLPFFVAGLVVAGSSHPVTRFVHRRWEMWRAWSKPAADAESGRSRRRRRPPGGDQDAHRE
jgi:uncharacterized membrane protein YbaN (DUF454 family)